MESMAHPSRAAAEPAGLLGPDEPCPPAQSLAAAVATNQRPR